MISMDLNDLKGLQFTELLETTVCADQSIIEILHYDRILASFLTTKK
jgi:hypothetical protein